MGPAQDRDDDHRLPMRRTAKDSVFTSLFSDREYTLRLYRSLHPEDADARAEDVEIVTLQNVLTTDQHNDLGFVVGDRLLVLVEAQSTWSPNIVLRALLYAAQTIKDYVRRRRLDLYGPAPVRVPKPELYVVYTGRREVPGTLTLSDVLFGGERAGIESEVRVLREADSSPAGQYIDFARTLDGYREALGPNEDAVRGAIADCVGRGVLAEYLTDHETEVVGIMITLYDEEEVARIHQEAVERELLERGLRRGIEQGIEQGRALGIEQGIEQGRARGIVAMCREFDLSLDETAAKLAAQLGIGPDEAEALARSLW
jgi:hypothetical protein